MSQLFARCLVALLLTTALAATGPSGQAASRGDTPPAPGGSAPGQDHRLSRDDAMHVLNRLAYGPRPDDVDRLRRVGFDAWLDEQLTPAGSVDDDLARRLRPLTTLGLDAETIFRDYHQPAQLERRRRQRERAASGSSEASPAEAADQVRRPGDDPSDAQRRDRQIMAELEAGKLLRAVYSQRQLEEVLVDFWFNHFNVFAGKGPTRAYVTAFERDAIRPHVLGRFRDMLEAVAASPAMLFYLDNWQSRAPQTTQRPQRPQMAQMTQMAQRPQMAQMTQMAQLSRGAQRPQMTQMPRGTKRTGPEGARGLNENYARELLELHTLGVDGGYTQADVSNVARAFTGWTMRPMRGPSFQFVDAVHDRGDKVVLGQRITAGGIGDGRQVLDLLSAHPATARFIATKLAQKFISDTPPASVVDRAAETFARTGGDLRAVTRAVIGGPEFLAAEARRAKVKTPLEFVASALRATGAEVRQTAAVERWLRDLGMPLYFCQPPTGYDEAAETWVSSGALVSRMNFALELGGGRLRGVRLPMAASADVTTLRATLVADALGDDVSEATRSTLAKATTADQVVALAIGSPEFQRQ